MAIADLAEVIFHVLKAVIRVALEILGSFTYDFKKKEKKPKTSKEQEKDSSG